MSVVTVRHKLFAADESPVAGRTVTAELIAPAPFLANHTASVVMAARVLTDTTGLFELRLTPQLEIAASGTHYVIRVAGTKLEWHCVVPNSGPVELANILVDPATLNPVAPEITSLFIPRVERGAPNGVAPLGSDGKVPAGYLPSGGGGAVESVNGQTGTVVLAAADVGAPPTTRQVTAGTGLTGGGSLAADRSLGLNSATITSLAKADTAVQPGALAPVATTGAYADLTGKPSIPDSYDDLTGTVPTSALPSLAVIDYLGSAASQTAMLALVGQKGDWCTRTDLGTVWIIKGSDPTQLSSWQELSYPTAPVLSVNGQTGAVSLAKGDVGLGNVANLAPADLGISTATQTALDGKQAADADLSTIAGLAPADGALLQRVAGVWAAVAATALPVSTDQQAAINTRIAAAIIDAKGDLLAGSAADTPARHPVGSDGQVLIADSSQATGLRWGTAGGDRIAYEPSAYGYLDWTTDPLACSADFPHNSGVLLMVRFRYRGSASTISELGFAVASAASGPGAFSGVALYADGTGTVARLGQSADAGVQWTTPGPKSVPLSAAVSVVPGNYYRAALLWQGSGSGRIAGPPTVVLDALLNHGVRRSTYLTGQTGFPATVDVSAMNTNNTAYFMSMK